MSKGKWKKNRYLTDCDPAIIGRKKKRQIAVIDFETDPFMFGRVPKPFCVEFFSDTITQQFWGDDCADRLVTFLEALPDNYLVYAHNGGKFDFHFLHKYIDNPALIISNRIVECRLLQHTMRDSYAILPIPLKDFSKMDFDYAKMEREVREEHKSQILEYLHDDCVQLFKLVSEFNERFGPRMTIGGTAIKEIRKIHKFNTCGARHDKVFRDYYFGGRVECFGSGIISGPIKLVDVNSSYPASMRNRRHPINGRFDLTKELPSNFEIPYFARIVATNRRALPCIDPVTGGLDFNKSRGEFFACSHEIEVALKYGLLDIEQVISCYVSTDHISFKDFVDTWNAAKILAKETGDKAGYIFAKLIMNSGYGRAGINPENFADWTIFRDIGSEEEMEADGYKQQCSYEDFELWSRKAEITDENYCDVAIAASITSASRALLLDGLQNSIDPVYCDTDSIICRDFKGHIHPTELGAWDLEVTADNVAIAGKKLYALYDNKEFFHPKKKEMTRLHKLSSKGGTLTLDNILTMCDGGTVHYDNAAPSFSLKKPPSFVSRNFVQTAKIAERA